MNEHDTARRAAFEALARDRLAPYGVTDLHFDWLGRSDYDGRELVNIVTPSTYDIEVAEMIANDLLKPGPLFLDINAYGAGETFLYKGWDGKGGACFSCTRSDPVARIDRRYNDARIRAGTFDGLGETIKADGIMALAGVDRSAAMGVLDEETLWECHDERETALEHVRLARAKAA